MTEYCKQSRLEALAALVLMAEASGTTEGWRDYLTNEMTTAGLTNRELRAEIALQRSSTPPGSGGRSE